MNPSPSRLDNYDGIFEESMYEHCDSVLCIEKNPFDSKMFLSTGKDSLVNIWKFEAE